MIEDTLNEIKKEYHGTLKSYLIGFVLSLLLTITSFSVVSYKNYWILIGLGIVQAIVQLRFFLHLGKEPKPRWESLTFYFMLLILLIVALGSLWIMFDLNDRMMPPMQEMHHHHHD